MTRSDRAKLRAAVLAVFITFAATGEAAARTPTEQIQETLQQVKFVVNSSTSPTGADRQEILRQALMPRFDFFEMAKRTLGKHWNSVPDRQHEFVSGFAEFLGNAYVGRISSYKDEKVLFVAERIIDQQAEVETQLLPRSGDPLSINYRLHRVGGEWKIYDVVVEQISIISNYRSQFNRILTTGSFDDLMARLREKRPVRE